MLTLHVNDMLGIRIGILNWNAFETQNDDTDIDTDSFCHLSEVAFRKFVRDT